VPWGTPCSDPPDEDVIRASYHLRLGDLVLRDSGWVGLTIVFKGRIGPVLERLDQAAAETDGHYGAVQPLRLELLQVVQQGHELLGVQHRQLVGPFRAYELLEEDHVWFEDRWMAASLCDE
jgi:hypothetical protein